MLKKSNIKLRLRRMARRQKRQVEEIGTVADERINQLFFRRLSRLVEVRRFVIGWIGLMLLLIFALFLQFGQLEDKYKKLSFVEGGIFTEGIVGNYTNANPIYAVSSVDTAVSELVFSGLFKYDSNGKLVSDLAEKIDVDTAETTYTVTLKENLFWHDGQKLTAEDATFTFNTIKNPDAQSHLLTGWSSVSIETKDERTVIFKLTDSLSSFPHSLTTGIIPKHKLKDIAIDQLRSSDFNTIKLVGSGPFEFEVVDVDKTKDVSSEERNEQIGLIPNARYHFGKPKFNRYVIKTYKDQQELEQNYREKNISAMAGVFLPPDDIQSDEKSSINTAPLAAQTMIFFKSSEGILSDPNLRKSLVLAANKKDLIDSVGYPLKQIGSPFLSGQPGYDESLAQKTNSIDEAKSALDLAGWLVNAETGIRSKDGKPLEFKLVSELTPEYGQLTQVLQKQWKELGVDLKITLEDRENLKNTLVSHNYDALLYAISTGADPDVFVFWHSSQSDPRSKSRLNFSDYNSNIADEALKAGRSRTDPVIRAVKYRPFLEAWKNDNPALALYQPRFVLVTRSPFQGFDSELVISPADRYSNIENWAIKQELVSN